VQGFAVEKDRSSIVNKTYRLKREHVSFAG